jgi:hypothetical protein
VGQQVLLIGCRIEPIAVCALLSHGYNYSTLLVSAQEA